MDNKLEKINKIIELDGHCYNSETCLMCPFLPKCAHEILCFRNLPSNKERVEFAITEIVNDILLDPK